MTPKVFLSYAREDSETALKLYHDLKKEGIDVWLDKEKLIPGQNWKHGISQAIKDSTHFLALFSSESITKRGFFQKELKKALDVLDEMPEYEIYFIPVRLDECQPANEKLQDIHWADLFPSYQEGLKKILRVFETQTDHPGMCAPVKNSIDAKPSAGKIIKKVKRQATQKDAIKKGPVHLKKAVGVIAILAVIAAIVGIFALKNKPIKLRDNPASLSPSDVQTMLGKHKFFDTYKNKSGDFKNDFKDNGDGTVTDRQTGLMWQKGGSEHDMPFKQADDYVRQVNQKGLGGYNDWRFPTLEELASLLESEKMNGDLYIDPVFDKNQWGCWSANLVEGSSNLAWVVSFDVGFVNDDLLNVSYHVRAVRAGHVSPTSEVNAAPTREPTP